MLCGLYNLLLTYNTNNNQYVYIPGVGRPDLRTQTYLMALTYRKRSGDVVTRLPVPEGDNARWRGNIIGVDAVLTRFGNGKVRAVPRVAVATLEDRTDWNAERFGCMGATRVYF